MSIKVGTCSYCGTHAAFVLQGERQHILACGTCGAPISDMKVMPKQRSAKLAHRAEPHSSHERAMSRKPKKKKKSFKRRALGEIFDFIEDIFD